MLFPTLSVSVLGFAAVTCAAPHLHSRFEKDAAAKRESIMPAERGLTWTPKKRGNNFDQFASISNFNSFSEVSIQQDFNSFSQETVIVINQFEGNSFNNQQLQQEQELVILIQEQMFLLQSQNFIVDNIRKNHFNSKNNKNNNVNTVIVIVQQVNDNRGSKSNSRYFTRQIQSNSNSQEQVVIVIQESNVMNVGGSNSNVPLPTGVSAAQAQSTGSASAESASANIGTYQPDLSQFQGFNANIDLLPSGLSGFPSFNFGQQDIDPALIILENQQVFVEFVSQSSQSIDNSISSAEIISAVSGGNSNII